MTLLKDDELDRLFNEKKILPKDYHRRIRTYAKSGTKYEQEGLTTEGNEGHTFAIALRKNRMDPFDFSIVLRYREMARVCGTISRDTTGDLTNTPINLRAPLFTTFTYTKLHSGIRRMI